jgi:hypothetical protein
MKGTDMLYQPLRAFAIIALLLALPENASAERSVSNLSELREALRQSQGGETILLQPGDYGAVDIHDFAPTAPVVLRAAGTGAPVRFTGLNLSNVSNITLDGVLFDYRYQKDDVQWTSPFYVVDSQKVTISNSRFDGDVVTGGTPVDRGYGNGRGLSIDTSSDIAVLNNQISIFHRGLVVENCDRVTVSGNDISAVRSDGMNFVAVQSLVVEDNYVHDLRISGGSDDHPDMIQFWTAGTDRPTTDVILRNNVLNSGHGGWSQSILIGNEVVREGKAGGSMFYRNITITGNVIINSHLHGITVGETKGLVISNNTLIHNRLTDGSAHNPSLWTPQINVSERAENVSILNNLTPAINGADRRPDWKVQGNYLTQDSSPSKAGFVGGVFADAVRGDPRDLRSFTYLPEGPAGQGKLGAPRLLHPDSR